MGLQAGLGKSVAEDVREAVSEAVTKARAALGGAPELALVAATVDYEPGALSAALREALPGVPLHGATSSLGVLGSDGVTSGPGGALAVLLLRGASFATGHAPLGSDPAEAGAEAARQVRQRLGGKTPAGLLIHATPGDEEAVLSGVARELPGVPVFGGSAADHAIVGDWKVLSEEGAMGIGVSLAAVAGARWGGALVVPYQPTGQQAVVDKSQGRTVATLGGKPAGVVLNQWLGGALDMQVNAGGNVLAQTATRPLGVRRDLPGGGAHYVTVHPAQIHADDGRLSVFAQLEPGTAVCAMQGSEQGLIEALDPLVDRALAAASLGADEVRAGVLIYCAGCSAAVGDRLPEGLRSHLGRRLPGVPLLGFCTFGEQGHIPGLGNVHQNLALALVLTG